MSHPSQGEVFTGGATTSQHVDAEDEDHFQNTSFKLKRTRSLGLLDEFIDPKDQENALQNRASTPSDPSGHQSAPVSPSSASADKSLPQKLPQSDDDQSNALSPTSSHPPTTPTPPFITSPDLIPHDDTDLTAEPSRHVDYLSHQWDVADISKSWRYVISRRKDVANAARLENASWRTWAQRRSNLKTISPEEVNWSKDSDVTWLYGPILDDDDHDNENHSDDHRGSATATSAVAGDISIARKKPGPKPILKKRTVEDMMISHLNLRKLQIATARTEQEQKRREEAEQQARRDAAAKAGTSDRPPEYFDYNAISAKLNSQYKNFSQPNSRSGSSADLVATANSARSPDSSLGAPGLALSQQSASDATSTEAHTASNADTSRSLEPPTLPRHSSFRDPSSELNQSPHKAERHIHFNDEVQQCIAISDPSAQDYDDEYYDEYDDGDNDYYYNDDDDSYLYESYHDRNSLDQSSFGEGEQDAQADVEDEEDIFDEDDEDDDEDDDDEGGFFLRVRSPSSAGIQLPNLSSNASKEEASRVVDNTEDNESVSTTNSKVYKTIQLLPSTTLNYGSSDEESDYDNPYTSSLSHNVGSDSNRGYDYYYDYNTVYQVDPNHAIYGVNSKKTPDVVDVPENISMGSNFDYDIIENEDIQSFENAPLGVINHCGKDRDDSDDDKRHSTTGSEKEKFPLSSLEDSASKHGRTNPFALDESEEESSDSDNDSGGLLISARNSSQSLAQSVFGNAMTSTKTESEQSQYPDYVQGTPEPLEGHISSINPRYNKSLGSLVKQPHSSGSLSQQFLGGAEGMTTNSNNDEKQRRLSSMFFDPTPMSAERASTPDLLQRSLLSGGTVLPPAQPKASPLPPHTTSANAFLGKASPPADKDKGSGGGGGFIFESDSELEPEEEEDNEEANAAGTARTQDSYSSLSQVADKNGLRVASPESDESGGNSQRKGKALSVASFLGGWNKQNQS